MTVSQGGETRGYSERHRLLHAGPESTWEELEGHAVDPIAVGRGTAESMNHGFNDGAQRPMVQINSLR